jgi:hypothetical protein
MRIRFTILSAVFFVTTPCLAGGFPIRPVLEVRGGYGYFHPGLSTLPGTYLGAILVQTDLKVNLGQPYLSVTIPALFEAMWGTGGTPWGYAGYGGAGLKLEPLPRVPVRPYLSGGGLFGYGTDGTQGALGYGLYGDAGLAIGRVGGISVLLNYRLRWMAAGTWQGFAHEVLAGIAFILGR